MPAVLNKEDLMSQSPPSHGAGRVWALIGAWLGALVCFIGAAATASALGRPHKVATVVLAIVAIAFVFGVVVLLRSAILLEHSLRGPTPSAGPAAVARPRIAAHPKNGPASRIVAGVALLAVIAFLVFISVSLHSKASRSAFTQDHGLARTGTVTAVHSVENSTRYDSWTTYDYDVTLSSPVGQSTQTVVNDPTKDFQNFNKGDSISALVDPKNPDYAELPGHPVQSSRWWIAPLCIGAVFVALLIFLGYEAIRHRRHSGHSGHSRHGSRVPVGAAPQEADRADMAGM
jgi:hypothetical protein